MTNPQPLRISEEVIREFYFSLSPQKDNFEIYRLKKRIEKLVGTNRAEVNDHHALALLEYNLGNYDKAISLIKSLSHISVHYCALLAVAKLTLVQNAREFDQSEESILEEYFNSPLNINQRPLEFNVLINSISAITKRFDISKRLDMELSYVSKSKVHWKIGLFKNEEIIEPYSDKNIPRDMAYFFESYLQFILIERKFSKKESNFLLAYLSKEELNFLIKEYSAKPIEVNRDYSKYEPISI
ncbi:hypothetical protein [Leptospira terpstrae]|uniref:Uncharacterized protein n=1 Tax=Leptospira terpstrae serovar Hualin str. LT 11-33 = ATCC 700639 TaxID=1257025 RepID=N1VUI6_9LEPT|nr:hypothetical protein [Leptospira terpstrae]EMY60667.1 hypothetical protein LEP1GSC203_0346 [Leptospira terpstrae serovar Hualin str. LT 11-33 = ATCC 700639]